MACGGESGETDKGTPVSGPFTLHCDESVYPMLKVLTDGYMNVYPQVVITIDTSFKDNAWSLMDTKKIYSVVTVAVPSEKDSVALAQRNIYPQTFHFASDAIVFVTGDTVTTSWFTLPDSNVCLQNAVHPATSRFIIDQPASDNSIWLQSFYRMDNECAVEFFMAGKHPAILERVVKYPGETGIVGWSYLSEKANPEVKKWRARLGILPYHANDTLNIYPTQSALATGSYPLTRNLYLSTAEPYAGPATGFAAFVASDEGQRIIRLFGLAPVKTAPREVIVN